MVYTYITTRNQWVYVREMGERAKVWALCSATLQQHHFHRLLKLKIIENEGNQSYSSVTELLLL